MLLLDAADVCSIVIGLVALFSMRGSREVLEMHFSIRACALASLALRRALVALTAAHCPHLSILLGCNFRRNHCLDVLNFHAHVFLSCGDRAQDGTGGGANAQYLSPQFSDFLPDVLFSGDATFFCVCGNGIDHALVFRHQSLLMAVWPTVFRIRRRSRTSTVPLERPLVSACRRRCPGIVFLGV